MEFDEECDKLKFQRLAGGDIVTQPPLFSENGEFLFTISGQVVKVYSSATGEFVRELAGNGEENLISLQLELQQKETLVACTSNGTVFRWNWSTGQQKSATKLCVFQAEVLTFNLLNLYGRSEHAYAFVTTRKFDDRVRWFIFNTNTGEQVPTPCKLGLSSENPKVAVQTNHFSYIILSQGFKVYFINYKTWEWKGLNNANKVPVTVVTVHPTEELVATGDELGKIFLWRQFMDHRTVTTTIYHWHHTAVTSIAFSAVGTAFYSSGLESVLVKWNVERPELRDFLPRMCAIILHIAVNEDNTKIAISTADNGVQFVGNDNLLKNTLQEFTYISDDKTNRQKFPVGLRINPRTNTLVLNGRTGHLQCYSSYTKNFLYNIDIVAQNKLSMEANKILYDTQVVKAAFNFDWMATGEVYNDEQHLPELRLKFWKYDESTQNYTLNTNIELPHEGGFKALEFSNANQVENLLCASVGEDNEIRIWSLDESDSIYKTGQVWYCVAKANYKNLPIESISFSHDGSLLAAGCGNTLCIYKAESLKLIAALTGGGGVDGSAQKTQVRVPKDGNRPVNGSRNELLDQHKKTLQLFVNLLENKDEALLKELKKSVQKKSTKVTQNAETKKKHCLLDDKKKSQIYKKVMQMHELNLWQKVLVYQKLGINCEVHPQWKDRMLSYIRDSVAPQSIKEKTAKLNAQVHRLNMRERFKAKYRLHRYTSSRSQYDATIAQHLVPIMNILNLSENTKPAANIKTNGISHVDSPKKATKETKTDASVLPIPQRPAQIKHVQFAVGEYAYLVVVCTESRVLIWNLLTLRLQSILKLSVKHLAFDVQNNLIAAITKSNELHVFQPNVPLPIYQRRNLPNLHGAIWMPRKHMKQRSINVDWQAQSSLYFLTENQEIIYLSQPNDPVDDVLPLLPPSAASASLQYSTFGTFATKQLTENTKTLKAHIGPVVLGNTVSQAVKSLLSMSTHTTPPLSLMCGDFVKATTKPIDATLNDDDAAERINGGHHNGDVLMNGHDSSNAGYDYGDDDDDDDDDGDGDGADDDKANDDNAEGKTVITAAESYKLNEAKRRALLMKSEQIGMLAKQEVTQKITETQLQRIAEQLSFDFDF